MTTSDFKHGLHQHYKGGYYWALGRVTHHETGRVFVSYVALREPTQKKPHRGVEVRELEAVGFRARGTPRPDFWTDLVDWPDGVQRPRFNPCNETTMELIAPEPLIPKVWSDG